MDRDPALCIDHMLEAIANIEADIAGSDFERFRKDRRVRQLMERNLEITSEASRRLPQVAKDAEGQMPWRAVAGIGNVIRHDYHDPYPTVLWQTCVKDLQPLKDALPRISSMIATGNLRE